MTSASQHEWIWFQGGLGIKSMWKNAFFFLENDELFLWNILYVIKTSEKLVLNAILHNPCYRFCDESVVDVVFMTYGVI